ncbi:cleavage polyadenylation factor subunit fip1 [Coemansia brasiliensis]|uniref:Cleavage polyadenylation factor subunit fip1 n=1 Tax=Coemansia brasiliensis TaxID=2650707 RepID=A0A9W8LYB2_9FUNG|nr:cleavage polyadenylation factor subunit fip1 [Coemansia brasiliensis]
MSNVEDDVDAFLYGDVESAGNSVERNVDLESQDARNENQQPLSQPNSTAYDETKADESDGESSSSDDEDDIEVILEPGNSGAAGTLVAGNEPADAASEGNDADSHDNKEKNKSDLQGKLADNAEHMDILSVPLLNNLDLFTIDIDMLEEKPWRQPGADITDYFNFGFSEEAWKLYCVKQQDLRTKFSMHNMMPHMMMHMGNPAMFQGMMPPGMVPPNMRVGEQGKNDDNGSSKDGDNGQDSSKDESKDGASRMPMMPQQMRMGMPPGFFPPNMRGMPMNQQQLNMQMANLPPQVQMQMQMQMSGRPPMPPNVQGAHQRSGQNSGPGGGYMGRGAVSQMPKQQHADHRENERGSESGRSSRRHASRERSSSRHPRHDWEGERSHSRSHADRDRDQERDRGRDRDRGRRRDPARAEHDKATEADQRRASDRRKERSERSRGDRDRSDRSAHKRRRSVSKDSKSSSRRRH